MNDEIFLMNKHYNEVYYDSECTGADCIPRDPRSKAVIVTQVTALIILGIVIVLGNLASIITYIRTQSLRRRSHYLIINLAIADLLVGFVDFITVNYFLYYTQNAVSERVMLVCDTFAGIASVVNLAGISIYRCISVIWPLRHRRMSIKYYSVFLAFPWFIATLVPMIHVIQCVVCDFVFSLCFIVIPSLAVMTILASYAAIGWKIRKSSRLPYRTAIQRDTKTNVTLMIVTLASLVTWVPHQCLASIEMLCAQCKVDINIVFFMKFLQYTNSGLNIFIYISRMPDFRVAFLSKFCTCIMQTRRLKSINRIGIAMATIHVEGEHSLCQANEQREPVQIT